MVAIPVAPFSVDAVVTNLVLEPLKFLKCDVAEVGGYKLDPIGNGCKVVEGGKGSVGVVVELVVPSDGDLGRVWEGFVGGVLPSGRSSGWWKAGDLEDRVLDLPGFDRVGAGEAAGVV